MAEHLTLDEVMKNIRKQYGDVVNYGAEKLSSKGNISFSTPSLDYMMYNAIPQGICIEISGKEASGKTTLAYLLASSYMKEELKRNPDDPRKILFVDAEGTANPDWALTSTGYDMNDKVVQTIKLDSFGGSMEQIFDTIRAMVLTGEIGLVILDSLVSLSPQLTNEESFEKKDMGGIAKPLADFVKRMTGVLNRYKCTFIGINGVIMNIGGYGNPETTPGGEYWKRACSLRLRTKRGSNFDADGNELKQSAESPAGNIIEVALLKSKFCRSDRRLGRTYLNYVSGIDILQDTIDTGILMGLIDNSSQGIFKLCNPETGEILTDDDGNELKIRGKKNLKPYFLERKDLWKQLYDKEYELMVDTEPKNWVSFEQMLGIDMKDYFGINLEDSENL